MRVAKSFPALRQADGGEFVDAEVENSTTIDCDLAFPHNGEPLEDIVFKADSMDVKWDLYIYDSVYLFARSWTGQRQYRAFAEMKDRKIRIRRIKTSTEHVETARQTIYSLLGAHAMGWKPPHTIPRETPDDPRQIALLTFSLFGNLGCYAAYGDIASIPISRPPAET